MVDWMNYSIIQEQNRKGYKKSQVARKLGINRETLSVYWNMTPAEYAARVESAKTRTKKADPHKDFVLECLLKYPDMSAAQVDMGEISLETLSGRHKKVYCFGMVMTHSRYKFILWQENPFTTDTFVQVHIKLISMTALHGFPLRILFKKAATQPK